MRTLAKLAATLGVVGTVAAAGVAPASALGVYIDHRPHHHYYNYYAFVSPIRGPSVLGRVGIVKCDR
jgi:hypothetical protein